MYTRCLHVLNMSLEPCCQLERIGFGPAPCLQRINFNEASSNPSWFLLATLVSHYHLTIVMSIPILGSMSIETKNQLFIMKQLYKWKELAETQAIIINNLLYGKERLDSNKNNNLRKGQIQKENKRPRI